MIFLRTICLTILATLALSLSVYPTSTQAHGGVVEDDDLCVINIGYLRAHFKIYLPQERQHREYCEDIPSTGESVFVMEYQHDGLSEAEIDFRIVRNVTGRGKFARLEDVEAIEDIDAVTLRYEPAAVVVDVFTLLQRFDEEGEYIGIVSALRTDTQKVYTAVFPFKVGRTSLGYWPWIIAALLALQCNYWYMNRSRTRRATNSAVLALCGLILSVDAEAQEETTPAPAWTSDAGYFVVSFKSDLDPLTINKMHSWILHIEKSDGEAAADVKITFSGGMPEHNHGLPTKPRIAENLAHGNYRVEGVRFHMNGYWEIRVSIDDGTHRDDVTIPLQL